MPKLLEDTLKESVKKLEQFRKENKKGRGLPLKKPLFKTSMNPNIKISTDADKGFLRADMVMGRNLWLEQQKFLLTNTAKVLPTHKWSIVEPASGLEWFTSDHPVVRLNYYKDGVYDLKGGWGNPGTNLFMPLSPKHLLFTQIGDEFPDRMILSVKETKMYQKILAERALRWIYSRKPLPEIEEHCPRHIDPIAIHEEEKGREKWHDEQSSAELRFGSEESK